MVRVVVATGLPGGIAKGVFKIRLFPIRKETKMKKTIVQITTSDTNKIHEFTGAAQPKTEQVWYLELFAHPVDSYGGHTERGYGGTSGIRIANFYLERQSLANTGALGKRVNEPEPTHEETIEQLIIKLLQKVGVDVH